MRSTLTSSSTRSLIRGTAFLTLFLVAGWAVSGCDLLPATSSGGSGTVQMAFEAVTASSGTSTAGKQLETNELVIEGTNGTLRISRLALLVGEFELEGADAEEAGDEGDSETSDSEADEDEEGTDDAEASEEREDAEEQDDFERGPFWMDLPLDGSSVAVTQGELPTGIYEEVSFEVEDLELDGDEESGDLQTIRTELEDEFGTWPESASMVVVGTFAPDGETSSKRQNGTEFTTFFEAEIEIEKELSPPLEVGGDGAQEVTIQIDPERWLKKTDGTVRDLSAHDYETTGSLIEFELEIEEGFAETEIEQEFEDEEDEEEEREEDEDEEEEEEDEEQADEDEDE